MNCRICSNKSKKINTFDNIPKHVSVLKKIPFNHEGINVDLFKCNSCNHYQIKYVNDIDYYDEYSMIPHADSIDSFRKRQINELVSISKNKNSFIDIGCGDGGFLEYASKFYNNVIGNEPSKIYSNMVRKRGFECIESYINPKTTINKTFDSFCSKQVFEHLPDPVGTLKKIYDLINDNGTGFIEIPNGAKTMYNKRYFDIFTDHVNYFTPTSLSKLVEKCGFTVLKTQEVFNGDYLECYFRKDISKFSNIKIKKEFDINFILKHSKKYKNIGMYGAGAKGYVLLTNIGNNLILKEIFDDDPNKQYRYLPNSSVTISLPKINKIKNLDLIIISAASYQDEILKKLKLMYNFKGDVIILQNNTNICKV